MGLCLSGSKVWVSAIGVVPGEGGRLLLGETLAGKVSRGVPSSPDSSPDLGSFEFSDFVCLLVFLKVSSPRAEIRLSRRSVWAASPLKQFSQIRTNIKRGRDPRKRYSVVFT